MKQNSIMMLRVFSAKWNTFVPSLRSSRLVYATGSRGRRHPYDTREGGRGFAPCFYTLTDYYRIRLLTSHASTITLIRLVTSHENLLHINKISYLTCFDYHIDKISYLTCFDYLRLLVDREAPFTRHESAPFIAWNRQFWLNLFPILS